MLFGAAFLVGYLQGALRQVLGLGALLFSFVLAANLRGSTGDWFATYWTTVPVQFSQMFGFGFSFLVLLVLANVLIAVFYKKSKLITVAAYADEVVGGVLGVILAVLTVSAAVFILDSFYLFRSIPVTAGDVEFLRSLHRALDESAIVPVLRSTVIPVLITLPGPLIPQQVQILPP